MNVTVFGATGGIGRLVVDQLRSNGHRHGLRPEPGQGAGDVGGRAGGGR